MTRMVTPGYAPPEQYASMLAAVRRADIYGLAATLYWLLTARAPTPAIDRQTGTPLTPPYQIVDSVSKSVSDGVLDGLELNPGHRPQTIEAFLARIGCGLPAPNGIAAPNGVVSPSLSRRRRRRPIPM